MKISFATKLLLVGAIITVFSACKSKKTEQMLAQIDQLVVQVDSSHKEFLSIDTAALTEAKTYAKQQLDYLQRFNTDTTYKNARYIDVYNSNFKLMRKLLKGYNRLGEEIEFSKNQLNHLSNDIKNGFAADSSYSKYFAGETRAVSKIITTTSTLQQWEARSIKRYNGMVLPIDSVVTELQSRGLR
ncbi:MAG: hypothetical protein ACI85Q_002041 [Salibacteraceae bacterium]|jgi:hypothetical protein